MEGMRLQIESTMQKNEDMMDRASKAAGPDASSVITELGLKNSRLRDELLLLDMKRFAAGQLLTPMSMVDQLRAKHNAAAAAGQRLTPAVWKQVLEHSGGAISRAPELVKLFQDLRKELLGVQVPSGGGAKIASGGGGKAADPAMMMAELRAKGGRAAKIEADYEEHRAEIARWAAEVRTFKPITMEEVETFVKRMEAKLSTLYEETEELRMFGEWPESKYDNCKTAAAMYRQLVDLRTKAQKWKPAGRSCQDILGGLQRSYDELVWKVDEYMRERDPIEKRYKEVGLPWPGKTLIDSVRVASLKYGLAHTAATRKEVHRLALMQPPPHNLKDRQVELLTGAVNFLFRTHQFVSGVDAATRNAAAEVAHLLLAVRQETFVADPCVASGSV
eukprot:gene12871-12997_t